MININDLCVGYGENIVLEGINLNFSKGKTYGIIGPNGSGKSTLLKAINGELKLLKGKITIDGKAKDYYGPREYAKKLSYMRQSPLTKFPFKVKEIVSMGRYCYHKGNPVGEDLRVIDHYIKINDLTHLKEKTINHLSGGEFQRTIFAKTLSQESEILLIDEGMSNADLHYKIKLMKHLNHAAGSDKLVLCVLHDLSLARKYCDELIILHEKQVVGFGLSHQVLDEKNLKKVFQVDGYFQNNSLIIR